MTTQIKDLKKRLKRAIRGSPALNQKIVAEKVGISQSYLNEILNDNKTGSFDLLNGIAEAIGMTFQQLLSNSELSDPPEFSEKKIVPQNKEEEQLLIYFRALNTKKRFLLLSIASDYYEYCNLIEDKEDDG